MTPTLDLFDTFVHLRADGSAEPVAWRPDSWETLVIRDGDRLLGALHGIGATAFHPEMAEMHPEGDELLYLITARST